MWEDELNKYGGRWVISIGRCSKLELDKLWLDVVRSWESRAAPPEGIKCPPLSPQLLILIGEAVQHTEEICGAVINLRSKSNKICKQVLQLPPLPSHILTHTLILDSNLDCQRTQRDGRHGDWAQAAQVARIAATQSAVSDAQGLDDQAGIAGEGGLHTVSPLRALQLQLLVPLDPFPIPSISFSFWPRRQQPPLGACIPKNVEKK